MAREPRLTFRGATHHAMARAIDERRLFEDDDDRHTFLELMGVTREKYDIEWEMFTLMRSHFHSKLRTPHGNISEAMKYLLSKYAQQWNRRRRKHGQLLRGRFKAPIVEDGRYAFNVIRYIALNPVKAGYVARASDWPWASHRALARLDLPVPFLSLDWLRTYFDGPTLKDCQRQYRSYIEITANNPLEEVDPLFDGSDEGAADVRDHIGRTMHGVIVPRSYRTLAQPPLETLFPQGDDLEVRNHMILRAQVVHGYTQSEIARALALHPNTISKITRRIRKQQQYFDDAQWTEVPA
jgi:REP element-mobilizing transposase RayT